MWDSGMSKSWGIVELIMVLDLDCIGWVRRWTATKSLQIPYVLNDLLGGHVKSRAYTSSQ